jgi:hypothetical protein
MHVSQPPKTTVASRPRQFSLWGLMVFVTVFSLWCSQFAVIRDLLNVQGQSRPPWTSLLSILLVWCVLSVYYYCRRVFSVLAVHCTTLVMFGLVPMMFGILSQNAMGLVILGLIVNLVCFPYALTTMAVQWWLRPLATDEAQARSQSLEEPLCEPQPNAAERESSGR